MDKTGADLIRSTTNLSTQSKVMSPFLAELIGTMILIVLGDGVVANVLLNKSKGQNSGWIVITTGWALSVAVAVYCVFSLSGAHLNPPVALRLAAVGKIPSSLVPTSIVAPGTSAGLGGAPGWLAHF